MPQVLPRKLTGGPTRAAVSLSIVFAVLVLAGSISPASATPSRSAAASGRAALELRVLNVRDRLARTNAFRMLVPAGWRANGGIVWDFRFHTLASVVMQIHSQGGPEAIESYPLIPHVWDKKEIFGFAPGSIYLGAVVVRPLYAAAYLEQLAIPSYRGRLHPRVIERVRLRNVARTLNAQARKLGIATTSTFDAARVRISYVEGGRRIEEDFYTVVSYTTSPILPGRVSWEPHLLYSFRAARGKLDRSAALLQAMTASVRLNVRWYAGLLQVQKLWIDGQMQAIRAAGALSRTIARANDQITESIRSSYRDRDEAYDRVYESFSEHIRGVGTYRNPFDGSDVQLPSDYSYAWVSASGEYALSDDAGFNPNVGSPNDWRLVRS